MASMTINQQQWLTVAFLVFWAFGLILWDVFAYLKWGADATISQTLMACMRDYPLPMGIGLVSTGIVIGHCCLGQYVQ